MIVEIPEWVLWFVCCFAGISLIVRCFEVQVQRTKLKLGMKI